jgi:hypothetical protein
MSEYTIFLLTGASGAGKTVAAARIMKLLRPYNAKFASLITSVDSVIERIYAIPDIVPWIVDNWTSYEEAVELKSRLGARLITIEIRRYGATATELPMGRFSHMIENNGTITDLEAQLGAMLRQYYPAAGR